METCTDEAPDAIPAFAVPNPNGLLAEPSVFSGSGVQWIAPPHRITQSTSDQLLFIEADPFDRRRAES